MLLKHPYSLHITRHGIFMCWEMMHGAKSIRRYKMCFKCGRAAVRIRFAVLIVFCLCHVAGSDRLIQANAYFVARVGEQYLLRIQFAVLIKFCPLPDYRFRSQHIGRRMHHYESRRVVSANSIRRCEMCSTSERGVVRIQFAGITCASWVRRRWCEFDSRFWLCFSSLDLMIPFFTYRLLNIAS